MKTLLLLSVLALSSCGLTTNPTTGKLKLTIDPAMVQVIADKGTAIINEGK